LLKSGNFYRGSKINAMLTIHHPNPDEPKAPQRIPDEVEWSAWYLLWFSTVLLLAAVLLGAGCATRPVSSALPRRTPFREMTVPQAASVSTGAAVTIAVAAEIVTEPVCTQFTDGVY
jgi:hypothetical protein